MTNCLCLHSRVIRCLYPPLLRNTGQNNRLVSAETVCHPTLFILRTCVFMVIFAEMRRDVRWFWGQVSASLLIIGMKSAVFGDLLEPLPYELSHRILHATHSHISWGSHAGSTQCWYVTDILTQSCLGVLTRRSRVWHRCHMEHSQQTHRYLVSRTVSAHKTWKISVYP